MEPTRQCPRDYFDDDSWPTGTPAENAPPFVGVAASAATVLADGALIAEAARRTGLPLSVLTEIAAGRAWPDLRTLAHLEMLVGRTLWR